MADNSGLTFESAVFALAFGFSTGWDVQRFGPAEPSIRQSDLEPPGRTSRLFFLCLTLGLGIHKVVKFFLFDYLSGDLADHDHEIEEARWMALGDAACELSYEGEREIVRTALSRGAADR
jgi:hypothetical protein